MANIKVIHLEMDGQHYYFGSLKALHETIGVEKMGMKFSSFHSNVRVTPEAPYVNRRKGYIIREGVLVQTKTNRHPWHAKLTDTTEAVPAAEPVVEQPVAEPAKTKTSKKKAEKTETQQLDLFG